MFTLRIERIEFVRPMRNDKVKTIQSPIDGCSRKDSIVRYDADIVEKRDDTSPQRARKKC